MKRIVILIFAGFLVLGAVYAQADDAQNRLVSGSFTTSTGLFFGGADNATFDSNATDSTEEKVYSRSFDENFVPYLAIDGQLDVANFFVYGGVLSAIPVPAGASGDANYPDSDAVAYRSKSENDSRLNKHFLAQIGLGYTFKINSSLSIAPAAGFSVRIRSVDGVDGKALLQGRTDSIDVTGVYMSSTEVTLFPSIGLKGAYAINEVFEVQLGGSFFPYVVSESELRSSFPYIEDQYQDFTGFGGTAELALLIHPPKISYLSFLAGFNYEGIYLKEGEISLRAEGFNVPEAAAVSSFSGEYNSTLFKVILGVKINL
jgi:hypothetical protein